ncbi:MAG: glycosyltransferase family 4 protein [Deltaproteobacteria bacterium]|nr:glycosyltransferase family 4 protein [Deltaproteobacteria bacterium]
MINVLHIHTLPIISGSGINTFLTMRGMDRSVFQVELACAPGGRLIDLVRDHHMKVRTFSNLIQPLHPLKDLSALINLTSFLKKRVYHVVHTHNSKAGFLGRLAARLAGVPVIIHTVHGFAFHDQEPLWRQFLFRNFERLASRWCDKTIFISQPLIDWALKERVVDEDKIIKIYSGIELDQFRPVADAEKKRIRRSWNIGEEESVIGVVSKLWEGKGHAVLIEAFREFKKEIKDARLVIVGEGYIYDDLTNLVERLGLSDSVLFTGFQTDVSGIIATFDVAVLPSFFEGMGRVLLEAMAMEKPVVASRVGGIPDLVEDGVNGFLTGPGDTRGLLNAMKKILSDKKLGKRMGKEGRKKISDQFSAEVMVKSINKVYNECLSRKGIRLGS